MVLRMTDGVESGRTVFISYSHKNSVWMDRLRVHLSALQMQNVLDVWVNTDIETGEDWKPEIIKALNNCSVAILLVTAEFLTSNFILTEEVPELLRRRHEEGLTVYPVICEPCPWKRIDWLAKMKLQPKDGKELSGFPRHGRLKELANIAEAIADIIGDAGTARFPFPGCARAGCLGTRTGRYCELLPVLLVETPHHNRRAFWSGDRDGEAG